MKGKLTIGLLTIAILVAIVAGCAAPAPTAAPTAAPTTAPTTTAAPKPSPSPTAAAKVIEIIHQSPFAATSRTNYAFSEPLMNLIEKNSGGRIKFKRFDAASLVPATQQLEATARGAIDMTFSPGTYYKSVVPEGDWDLMAFNYPSQASAALFLDLPEVTKIFRDAYAKQGVVHLGAYAHSNQTIMSKTPINTLEDLKGKKIRAAGGLSSEAVKAWGAADVFIETPELYVALQRGTVDGAMRSEYNIMSDKMYEVTKYVMSPGTITSQTERYFISQKKWDELGPELQKVVQDAFRQMSYWFIAESYMEDEVIRDQVTAKGMTYIRLPEAEVAKMKAALEPIRQNFAKLSPGCAQLMDLLKAWEAKPYNKFTLAK